MSVLSDNYKNECMHACADSAARVFYQDLIIPTRALSDLKNDHRMSSLAK
jgi:hypothetical protein